MVFMCIWQVNAGQSGEGSGAEATLQPKEVEYASINLSALRRRGSEGREEATETEYAEIHRSVVWHLKEETLCYNSTFIPFASDWACVCVYVWSSDIYRDE